MLADDCERLQALKCPRKFAVVFILSSLLCSALISFPILLILVQVKLLNERDSFCGTNNLNLCWIMALFIY